MNLKSIKLYSQNIWKNRILTDMILETNTDFDIIFIQEPPWSTICTIPSLSSEEGDRVVGTSNHLNWITFSRALSNENDYPRVISYINIYLFNLCFSFWKDIFNYRNICCFSFFNNRNIFFLLNVYSDANQSALKYLKNTEANIRNVLVMTGDFNIRDSNWNPSYPFHSVHSNLLIDIVDTFNLSFLHSTNVMT